MKSATKILAILFCLLLCTGGAILARKESTKGNDSKTRIVPINHREAHGKIWIWA